jgi:hypothetical protein
MPKRIVAGALMVLSAVSVDHKPADAAPISPRGAVAETTNTAQPVGGCGAACYKPRVAVWPRWNEGYRGGPRVAGWSRRATIYRPRPLAKPSALWDPGFRYGAANWTDQRAWDYYGRW